VENEGLTSTTIPLLFNIGVVLSYSRYVSGG
jgi:hypothetical protein